MEIIKNIEEEQVLFIVNFLEDETEKITEIKKEDKIQFIIHPTCYFCKNTFKTQSELDLHKKESPECDLLIESTKRPDEQPHVKNYPKNPSKNHICKICFKDCLTASILILHMKCHPTVTNIPVRFHCKICNKTIFGELQMDRHRRKHLEMKRYKCDQCLKGFNCPSLLTVHLRGLFNFSFTNSGSILI